MSTPLRVALAGASGIGRHHAKWHAQVGSRVVAFLGSDPERLQATASVLRDLFGFDGRGYTDLAELLAAEGPDVIDVCTPNGCHYGHARQALEAGCHVLCEKPLVWNAAAPAAVSLAQARHLGEVAHQAGRQLALCSQYAAAFAQYRRLCPQVEPCRATALSVTMDTLSRGRRRSEATIWTDMGPHPLSLVLGAWPRAQIAAGSLSTTFARRTAEAEFTVEQDGHRCACRIVVRDRDAGHLERRFGFDGQAVDLGGRAGTGGVYRSLMRRGTMEDLGDDFMLSLIRQFTDVVTGVEATPLVPFDIALRNLELQAEVLTAT